MTVKDPKRIVFKVGSSTLIHKTGKTNLRHMGELVRALSDLRNAGTEVALVTSGAIGVGVGKLGLAARPSDTPGRQAAASVGQCELMFMYDKMFSQYGHKVGQLLITREDVEDELRRQNPINTFSKLFTFGAIPIINENDAVAVDEIVYGDNDSLSAVVAALVDAELFARIRRMQGRFDALSQRIADAYAESRLATGWRYTYGMLDMRFDARFIVELLYPAN